MRSSAVHGVMGCASDSTGGFRLLSNIQASNPLNINLTSPSDVELFGSIDDSSANVAITANGFSLNNPANHLNVGSGVVTIQPATVGLGIDLGYLAAGKLGITD